jgi:hypothetical protein
MKIYDPKVVGVGVDYWVIYSLGKELEGKVAVIDDIPCINPHDKKKGGKREIEKLQSLEVRKKIWEEVKNEKNIYVDEMREFGVVKKDILKRNYYYIFTLFIHYKIRMVKNIIKWILGIK